MSFGQYLDDLICSELIVRCRRGRVPHSVVSVLPHKIAGWSRVDTRTLY